MFRFNFEDTVTIAYDNGCTAIGYDNGCTTIAYDNETLSFFNLVFVEIPTGTELTVSYGNDYRDLAQTSVTDFFSRQRG